METKTFYAVVAPRSKNMEQVREIEVPADFEGKTSMPDKLEVVFKYGQNDFQPRFCPSLSMGDLVFVEGRVFLVRMFGYLELNFTERGLWKITDADVMN